MCVVSSNELFINYSNKCPKVLSTYVDKHLVLFLILIQILKPMLRQQSSFEFPAAYPHTSTANFPQAKWISNNIFFYFIVWRPLSLWIQLVRKNCARAPWARRTRTTTLSVGMTYLYLWLCSKLKDLVNLFDIINSPCGRSYLSSGEQVCLSI